jgi:hypothetical protein
MLHDETNSAQVICSIGGTTRRLFSRHSIPGHSSLQLQKDNWGRVSDRCGRRKILSHRTSSYLQKDDGTAQVADRAATGVHVALLVGPRCAIESNREHRAEQLRSFSATYCDDGFSAAGGRAQVLAVPLLRLATW